MGIEMNKSSKGARMERECAKALQAYFTDKGYKIIDQWHTHRSRAGGNDFLGSFDLAFLAIEPVSQLRYTIMVQVKSNFRWKDWGTLYEKWKGTWGECYLACYGAGPKAKANILTPRFHAYRVNGGSPLEYGYPEHRSLDNVGGIV